MSQQEQTPDDDGQHERPEAVRAERTVPFAGLTVHNNADLPDHVVGYGSSMRWWAEQNNHLDDPDDPTGIDESVQSFNTSIRGLPRGMIAEAAWVHPVTGDVIRTGKHNAVVNPDVVNLIERSDDGEYVGTRDRAESVWDDDWKGHVFGDDALYNIPTDDYTVVNPMEFLEPLAEVVRERGLGDALFGEFRLFRVGGKVSGDVFFNGEHVDVPGRPDDSKPIVVGFQIDWDHFGGTSIHAQGMAMNYECINSFRNITDEVLIKHTGDMQGRTFSVGDKEVSTWHDVWDTLFDLLDEKRDILADVIRTAMEFSVDDFFDLPENFEDPYRDERHNDTGVNDRLYAMYRYAGLPGYLAKEAARDASSHAENPFDPDFWTLHSGATYAISHHSRAEAFRGSAMDGQIGIANDLLFNPTNTAERIEQRYTERIVDEDGSLAEEGGGIASIVRDDDVNRAKEQFERREEHMRALAPEMDAD